MAKLRGTDASRAWISFYCAGLEWIDMDSPNNCLASMRHVTLGCGRDYSDVAPVRGVMIGSEGQTLSVSVE